MNALELVELAVPVKITTGLRPAFPDDVVPLLAQAVTCLVVIGQFEPQCFILRFVPAADDIDAGASVAYLIQGSQLFRGNDGVVETGVGRGEYGDVFRLRQQSRSPGQGLQYVVLKIGRAAVTDPAGDGQLEFQAGRISELRLFQVVVPGTVPAFLDPGHGLAAGAVCGKDPQF